MGEPLRWKGSPHKLRIHVLPEVIALRRWFLWEINGIVSQELLLWWGLFLLLADKSNQWWLDSITNFCLHFTYIETLWKLSNLSNEAWNHPMEMFCSRHTFFLWPCMVLCEALQWNISHKMALVHLKVPYYHTLTLSSNDICKKWSGSSDSFTVLKSQVDLTVSCSNQDSLEIGTNVAHHLESSATLVKFLSSRH